MVPQTVLSLFLWLTGTLAQRMGIVQFRGAMLNLHMKLGMSGLLMRSPMIHFMFPRPHRQRKRSTMVIRKRFDFNSINFVFSIVDWIGYIVYFDHSIHVCMIMNLFPTKSVIHGIQDNMGLLNPVDCLSGKFPADGG